MGHKHDSRMKRAGSLPGLACRCLAVTALLQALWSACAFWYIGPVPNAAAMPIGMGLACVVSLLFASMTAHRAGRSRALAHAPIVCAVCQAISASIVMALAPASGVPWLIAATLQWVGLALTLVCGIACVAELAIGTRMGVVALAVVLSTLVRVVLKCVNGDEMLPSCIFSAISAVVACALSAPATRRLARAAEAAAQAPADIQLTQPASLLPLSHRIFVSVFSYGLVAGLAFYFGKSVEPLVMVTAVLPTPIVSAALFASKCSKPLDVLDALVRGISLIALCALCLFPVMSPNSTGPVFFIAEGLCYVLLICLVAELVARNPEGGPVVLARSAGLFIMGWGVCSWIVMDAAPNLGFKLTALFAASAFIILGEWCQLGPRLDASVVSVSAPTEVMAPADAPDELVVHNMATHCGMTARESEIFALLARGRNARFLQDELGIKRSTAKSHISHIYAKLGVHGQQELIDLVESHRHSAS